MATPQAQRLLRDMDGQSVTPEWGRELLAEESVGEVGGVEGTQVLERLAGAD
jgi:hypothetical protein